MNFRQAPVRSWLPRVWAPISTLSKTVNWLKSLMFWKVRPMPPAAMTLGALPAMGWSMKEILPSVGL